MVSSGVRLKSDESLKNFCQPLFFCHLVLSLLRLQAERGNGSSERNSGKRDVRKGEKAEAWDAWDDTTQKPRRSSSSPHQHHHKDQKDRKEQTEASHAKVGISRWVGLEDAHHLG